ncbi:hypothetical protein BJ742DRAFT_850920 [Cladochytrium replicatum]|nr:hypothetical protein BJ742DRAFT_850920 [Cladochytrium replicatum]
MSSTHPPGPLAKSDSTLVSYSAASEIPGDKATPNGVVILKDEPVPYPPGINVGPLSPQYAFTSDGHDPNAFQPYPPFISPPFILPQTGVKRTWWERYRWLIAALSLLLVLAGVIVPTTVVLANKQTSSNGKGTGSPSATSTSNPSPSPGTGYPIALPSGSLLFDPVVHPANNLQTTYNLTSIQPFVSVVNNSNTIWRYHVAFGRTLSAEEISLSSPITKSRCNTNTAVCQEQVGGPDAYNVAVVGTLGYTTVSINGTQGLQIAFEPNPGDPGFCFWRVTITIMCSAATTSAPKFIRVEEADDASTCRMDFTYLHSSGCAL